jgi:hypothetical protein
MASSWPPRVKSAKKRQAPGVSVSGRAPGAVGGQLRVHVLEAGHVTPYDDQM